MVRENSRLSSLLAAGTFAQEERLRLREKKFHTDNVKSVWNLVQSSDWST